MPIAIGRWALLQPEETLMPTLTIDEVQSRLPQIIDALAPGEELVTAQQ